jgi:hypothetical protein
MCKRFFVILVLLLSDFRMSLSQQEFRVDSLLAILEADRTDWDDRKATLDVIAWDVYLYYKPDSALFYARQLERESRAKGDLPALANALSIQGVAQKTMGNFRGH